MRKWFASNSGLLIISFILATGIVWIKGQERIDSRLLTNIQVVLDNLPDNMTLSDGWTPPTTALSIRGPRNILDYVRTDLSNFRVDVSRTQLLSLEKENTILLTDQMFKTNLEPEERAKITIQEGSIKPWQVVVHVLPWNIIESKPVFTSPDRALNKLDIPLYKMEKKTKIIVPHVGDPVEGFVFSRLEPDPKEIFVTGKKEALEQIESVTTSALDLTGLSENPLPIYLSLNQYFDKIDVKPVDDNLRGVTVSVSIKKKGK